MDYNLQFLFGDCPESKVKKAEIIIKVIDAESTKRFKIKDQTMTAFLEFKEGTSSMISRMQVGRYYKLFSVAKKNQNTLTFSKTSYLLEDNSKMFDETTIVDTKALINKKHNQFIEDTLMLKVLKIYEKRESVKGTKFQKVLVGDNHATLMITFWRDSVDSVENLMAENKVYAIKNVQIDDYSKDRDPQKPKDISYLKGKTIITEVEWENVPESLKTVAVNEKNVQGVIKFLDRIYEYKSCHGKNGTICRKIVKPGQTHCSKNSCAIPISETNLNDDYVVTLVLFDEKNDVHPITAFKKSLLEFEIEGSSINEKLKNILCKNVRAMISNSKSDDNPILSKLQFIGA